MSADQGDMHQRINTFSCDAVILSTGVNTAMLWADELGWHAGKLSHAPGVQQVRHKQTINKSTQCGLQHQHNAQKGQSQANDMRSGN